MMVMEATTAAMYANSSGVTKQQEHQQQQQQQQDVAAYQQSLPLQSYVQHHHYFLSSPPSSATSSSSSAAVFSASSSSTSPLALTPVWPSSVRGGSYPVGGSSQQPVLRSPSSSSELHQLIQGGGERAVAAAPSATGLASGCSPYSSLAFYQTDPQLSSVDAHSMFYSPHHQQGQQQYPAVDYGQYMMPYEAAANNSNVYSRSTTMSQQHLMLQRHQYLQHHQQQEKMAVSSPSNIKSEVGSGVNQLTMSTLPLPGGRGQQVEGTTRSMTSLVGGVSSGKIHKPPFAWMAKQAAANSAGTGTTGKTRTSDKYRVVYTDLQKVELEKEFLYSKYITIQRKAELARFVNLSERQVKIWFQNRRAKERKSKKHDDVMPASPMGNAHDDADSPSPDHVTEYVLPMKKCSQDDVMLSAAHRLRPDVNHHLFSSYIHGH